MCRFVPRIVRNLTIAITLLNAGCIVSWKPTSIGHVDAPGWKTNYPTYAGVGGTRIEKNGLAVTIRPHNEGPSSGLMILPVPTPLPQWGGRKMEKFWFSVDVRSRDSALTINPYEIILLIRNSNARPVRVIQRDVNPEVYLQCVSRGTDINPREIFTGFRSPLWPPACFDVYYDIPTLSVDEEFKLLIDGVADATGLIGIPEITFRRGVSPSGW